MSKREKELVVPPAAKSDASSQEMLRAWIADGGLHCTLSIGAWGDKETIGWGILLTDVVRHVADALHQQEGMDPDDTIKQIRAVFNKELDAPTADAKGNFITH
ncbi:MAG TPA: DUF5076 domain-containing protein [Terriglobales bacterium]|jgi:hypothetical protein|nr:DUF5076 domain-containing protein [Terriglobales bacterium]